MALLPQLIEIKAVYLMRISEQQKSCYGIVEEIVQNRVLVKLKFFLPSLWRLMDLVQVFTSKRVLLFV